MSSDELCPPSRGYSSSPMLNAAIRAMELRNIGSEVETPDNAQRRSAPKRPALSVADCPVVANTVADTAPALTVTKTLQAAIENLPPRRTRPWLYERFIAAVEAAGRQPHAYSFSVNLNDRREEALLGINDPAGQLRRYIARELRAIFGVSLPFAFAFDVSAKGKRRLHIHGVILAPDESASAREGIASALARAAGKIKGRGAGRQVDLDGLPAALGWAVYSIKHHDDVCRLLGTNKIAFVCDELTRLAKAWR